MPLKSYDVIVAGVGSMGSAACYHLARRGVRVVGIEQFDLPHARGSHHGYSRMIRQSYYEHPDYVPLLRRSYELWDDLNARSCGGSGGEKIFHRTGGLYLGPPDGAIVPGAAAAAREHGLSHELLGAREVEERFPAFCVEDQYIGFYEENAGFIVPELAVRAHADLACAHGAEIRTGEGIIDWRAEEGGVVVRTSRETVEAGHLLLTGGAWSGALLRELGAGLTVTRQVLAWLDPAGEHASQLLAPGVFPCWFIETTTPFGHYGFPMTSSGGRGFKIALHQPGLELVGADDPAVPVTEEEVGDLREILRRWIPIADGPLLTSCTCLYTNSPDGNFMLGPHPEYPGVTVAAGFSGHGFKFSPVVGEVLADFACAGSTTHEVGFLSWERLLPS